ncbi:hypothetical protein M378DRAFT_737554 [Amanita muscaria Koide BX008]|uniref:Uncharacterized protein n=1 Tax=Amanita muscaria (strain Koide BX008) TaxID=946122 RepID=A0A0C2SI56_AMAMK|nr:hypothetical protein M378DRAFT_737554 [Amanita muscaria Koide BX008]
MCAVNIALDEDSLCRNGGYVPVTIAPWRTDQEQCNLPALCWRVAAMSVVEPTPKTVYARPGLLILGIPLKRPHMDELLKGSAHRLHSYSNLCTHRRTWIQESATAPNKFSS